MAGGSFGSTICEPSQGCLNSSTVLLMHWDLNAHVTPVSLCFGKSFFFPEVSFVDIDAGKKKNPIVYGCLI